MSLILREYRFIVTTLIAFRNSITPYARRCLRFIALPYCYCNLIDWEECAVSHWQVAKDLLYIFFRLKYFPDNYSPCRLWEKDREEWKYYYGSIYEPYQRARLRKKVQRKEYQILFKDKAVCYKLCKAAGFPLPPQYGLVESDKEFKHCVREILAADPQKKMIIKPVDGKGGQGIVLAFVDQGNIVIQDAHDLVDLDEFELRQPSVVQQYLLAHGDLLSISSTLSTIRLLTFFTVDKRVILIDAFMRFGIGDMYLDSISKGGLAVAINCEDGTLKSSAYYKNGRTCSQHPDSLVYFGGIEVPFWHETIKLAEDVQYYFLQYRLLGIDIAITADGPVVIELNEAHDNVGVEQRCGPILADKRIREEFRKYDLLVNNKL